MIERFPGQLRCCLFECNESPKIPENGPKVAKYKVVQILPLPRRYVARVAIVQNRSRYLEGPARFVGCRDAEGRPAGLHRGIERYTGAS